MGCQRQKKQARYGQIIVNLTEFCVVEFSNPFVSFLKKEKRQVKTVTKAIYFNNAKRDTKQPAKTDHLKINN